MARRPNGFITGHSFSPRDLELTEAISLGRIDHHLSGEHGMFAADSQLGQLARNPWREDLCDEQVPWRAERVLTFEYINVLPIEAEPDVQISRSRLGQLSEILEPHLASGESRIHIHVFARVVRCVNVALRGGSATRQFNFRRSIRVRSGDCDEEPLARETRKLRDYSVEVRIRGIQPYECGVRASIVVVRWYRLTSKARGSS